MRLRILLFILITYVPGSKALAQADLLRKEIEKIIRYEQPVDFNIVPGLLIGVVDGDSTFRFSFGNNIPENGIYELGSITKPFVAWLINKALRSMNKDRNALVCEFIPDSLCSAGMSQLTFNHIIEHRTGLARLAPGIGEIENDVTNPYKDYDVHFMARDLRRMRPAPGKYSYSHMGYAMTYWLFEKVGGIHAFTTSNLTRPYLMHDTGFALDGVDIAPGHGLDGRPQPPWHTNALEPALGLKSSLNDMMTFIRLLFFGYEQNHETNKTDGLKRELKLLSKTGAYKVDDGWFVIRSENSLVYYHNGRTGGHHVSIAFTPHLKKGVVVISNGAMGSNDLSLLILRMVNQAYRRQNKNS